MAATTKLAISGLDLPPYAARGLTQSKEIIEEAHQFARTINGVLENLSTSEDFHKVRTTIQCTDMQGPAFSAIVIGTVIVVDCAYEESYKLPGAPEGTPGENARYTIVPGSIRTRDGFLFYRPRLTMMVTDFNFDFEEFPKANGWTLVAEEV